ncbi:711_t:CDS:2 [Diversispora eburnea]|uniref:711_t:CDS:1 n=1 Tax=Diversispora eburnea TaxID=1213867 RepID=A0A9N8VGL1_9GLOM|nr:711_t:CDS:2 [Diversispora eburnea]
MFNQNGPQPQFGGQPTGVINGPSGMSNEIVNDVYPNNKKILNPPPQSNTIPGINPTSSLFTSGLGPMLHPPHHGGPPMPMHVHPGMRQQIPPRGFNHIGATPHLAGPAASANLSLLNDTVIGGNGNIGSTGVNSNPPPGAFGGLPLGGGQGPLGPQTFNLQSSSHMGPNVVQNTPLAPIGHGHRRMSQHPEDPHVKVVQRPQPIQRPRRGSASAHNLETRTRSPPPGFSNVVGSNALLNEDQSHTMINRRQSLATVESSYFSNSLFSTLPGETSSQQSHPTQSPINDNEWPLIRRQGTNDNPHGNNISSTTSNDIWGLNSGQSLWYQEGNNTNRRVMGARDFGIP